MKCKIKNHMMITQAIRLPANWSNCLSIFQFHSFYIRSLDSRSMARCVLCVVCVKELDLSDSQPAGTNIHSTISRGLIGKSLVTANWEGLYIPHIPHIAHICVDLSNKWGSFLQVPVNISYCWFDFNAYFPRICSLDVNRCKICIAPVTAKKQVKSNRGNRCHGC